MINDTLETQPQMVDYKPNPSEMLWFTRDKADYGGRKVLIHPDDIIALA